MKNFLINNFLTIFPIVIALILWWAISFKALLLFYGLFNVGMYIHLTVTTLSNSFIGRDINAKGDVFWKMLFLTISTLCMTIFFIC